MTEKIDRETSNFLMSQNLGLRDRREDAAETLKRTEIDYLYYNLPAIKKVLDGIINYVFYSDLLIDGKKIKDLDISKFDLIKKFKEIYRELLIYGSVGVRKTKDLFQVVPKDKYDIILMEDADDRFTYNPFVYLINKNRNINKKTRYFDLDKPVSDNRFTINEDGTITTVNDKWLVLTPDEFINISNDDTVTGLSIFEYDKKRTHLLLKLLDYFIHDFERNGVGTLVFKYNENLLTRLTENSLPSSTGQIFDNSSTNKKENIKQTEEKIQKLTDELSKVQYEDSIIYSDAFSDFQQLNRDSKPSDYISMLDDFAYKYVTQLFNVNPQVFDFESTGNVGKDEVIKDFIVHNVISLRKDFENVLRKILLFLDISSDIRFSNEELVDYYDYNKDEQILRIYQTLKENGKEKEAEAYLINNMNLEE